MKYLAIDIAMAFVIAMLLNMFWFLGSNIKKIFVLVCGVAVCIIYILNGLHINFIGTIDFGIWIICVGCFDIVIEYILQRKNISTK